MSATQELVDTISAVLALWERCEITPHYNADSYEVGAAFDNLRDALYQYLDERQDRRSAVASQ